jgi:electron transport complex protein RnfG
MGKGGKLIRRGSALASALVLLLFTGVSTALVTGLHEVTKGRIAENERAELLASIARILPPSEYDNDPLQDRLALPESAPGDDVQFTLGYRARRSGEPVAVVLNLVARNGYNGDIALLVAIRRDHSIAGVDVLGHRETPGLGDRIEASKSSWLEQFVDRFIDPERPAAWKVKRDGGDFDQLTGATVTPRAVVGALRAALDFASRNHLALFERA